jgi:prepilin-type N-terminal cleavage/methylation domain-containing protein
MRTSSVGNRSDRSRKKGTDRSVHGRSVTVAGVTVGGDRVVSPLFAHRQRGVTLIEMLVVVTLIALVAGLTYPSVTGGLDSLRLRSGSDAMVGFLNVALDRADRRQQAVEIRIEPKENSLTARSADNQFARELHLPERVHISNPTEMRRFLLYPGGAIPAIQIEIATEAGRHRIVSVDPMTGVSKSEMVP